MSGGCGTAELGQSRDALHRAAAGVPRNPLDPSDAPALEMFQGRTWIFVLAILLVLVLGVIRMYLL